MHHLMKQTLLCLWSYISFPQREVRSLTFWKQRWSWLKKQKEVVFVLFQLLNQTITVRKTLRGNDPFSARSAFYVSFFFLSLFVFNPKKWNIWLVHFLLITSNVSKCDVFLFSCFWQGLLLRLDILKISQF